MILLGICAQKPDILLQIILLSNIENLLFSTYNKYEPMGKSPGGNAKACPGVQKV
ncbi:hypothetical protein [Hippea alviniae]|uniref:hypothetical protein n=1 Tax=Hippea alviniae TaxID=1279027 RepID=UPI000427F160|nr:hypothetical protein [Hippea alviniae]